MAVYVFLLVVGSLLISHGEGYRIGDNPNHRGDFLDTRERYHLQWMVNRGRITFNVTVQARGWILFGLANNAEERTGRDVVIGGVADNNQPYFSDRHTGQYNDRLEIDRVQDWTLENSWENGAYTFLSFSRDLETCDGDDYPITENKVTLIWAYGSQDNKDGSGRGNRGTYEVYLLDPEYSPRVVRQNLFDQVPRISGREAPTTQVWSIKKSTRIPRNDTSYLCRIHKAPRLQRKHHVIGFDVKFEDEASQKHVHHLVVHKCHAPRDFDGKTLFENFANSDQEQSCFNIGWPTGSLPTHLCQQVYIGWGVGGRKFFTPDHVGFPFGENEDEYYMTDVHYDNPEMREDIRVTMSLDFFYTRRLRPSDAGMMWMGHEVPGLPESTLIPPNTSSIRMFGHCGGECTKRMLPKEGITLVAALLHSHLSGKQLRMHHFRENEELPWILYDDNYNNQFQQIRALPRGEVQIYPGDQVTMDCTYDNTWTNDTVLGGYSTRKEMCGAYIVYHTLIPDYTFCRSEIVSPANRQRFLAGVTNITWLEDRLDWVAMSPSPRHLVGKTVTEISNDFVNWDTETRRQLIELKEQHPQITHCTRDPHAWDRRDLEQLLQTQLEVSTNSGQLGVVISGNIETNLDTENSYSGPVEYPSDSIAYEIAETSCFHRGYFVNGRN